MHIENISYATWQHCLKISNDKIEAIITLDVGPRIIRFGFIGGENEFVEYPEQVGLTGGDTYHSYGGHRLWVAPEMKPRTYYPDNAPVEWKQVGESIHLDPPVESTTGIQKRMEIWMDPVLPTVHVIHKVINRGTEASEMAAWAISVMAAGGRAILPQEPFKPHPEVLLPVRSMALWSYTNMEDSRWRWVNKFVQLRQEPGNSVPQKAGALSTQGWVGYANGDRLFVKTVPYQSGARYPDMNCNVELFTNARMLEVETLSPLQTLNPGEMIQHEEHWFLYKGVDVEDLMKNGLSNITE